MIKPTISLQDLRRKIYTKAKAEETWKFWGLYVHVYKMETLRAAYSIARKNDGAAGLDGVTFEDIEGSGIEDYLLKIQEELITETYRPTRNRKHEIPKVDGKGGVRTLSIPTIRDRVVQGALKLILEPIFEADFQEGSYGYRAGKSPHEAIAAVSSAIKKNHIKVIDLDLKSYFDRVRHDILFAKVAKRVEDPKILCLLKMIVKSSGKRGVPQGGVIEGLLGGLSGTAIEAGVDPLVADLSTLGIQGGASKSRNLLDRFSKSGRAAAREEKVTRLMKDITKEEGLDKLMNFNPENLDVIPVTAEVALNKDISNLHNAYAPNFTGIQSKMTANDEILRRKLNNIGSESNPTPIEVGEAGRAVISKKLSKLEKAREKAASPLYAKLEESPNLYPTENLNSYTEQAIAKELGDIEKGLNRNKSLLPDKYKRLAEKSKTELTELEKEVNKIITQVEKEYPGLSFQAKDQILNELMPGFRKKIAKISGLKEKIATLESGHYSPGHIDKAITEIGNNITELKRSAKGGNDSLIRHYTKQKKALEADLEATPEGLAHREVYREHSPEINKINRDRLLKKFVSKDEWDAYRVPVDDLPRNIMSSPKASVANYMGQVKGTPAEKLTKAYFRDKYLDKGVDFEGGLPTYDKSSRFLRERGHKLDAIYSPEELGVFKQINEYLKNRASVSRGNSTFGSATMPKQQLQEMVRGYLGSEVSQPLALAKYVPGLPFKNHIAGLTRPNTTYNILEQALTNPIYAKSLLTREPVVYSKPNYFPTLYNVLNGNQE